MDIKEQINSVVDKVKNDDAFKEQFTKEPVKAVESVIGVDLPDDVINNVIDGVKAKISVDKIGGALGSIKGMFGK